MNLGRGVTLHAGDNADALAAMADNSLDSCVTDPPYHLTSIVKRFGADGAAPAQFGTDGAFARASRGFMNKVWDGGDIAFRPEFWREVYRVLKPGAFLCAFGASRGYHRMACAIEDAGFEIRDSLMWIYGTGFPKSHDVSKGIDATLGADPAGPPATDEAAEWEGWGTALKPAFEPIVLARKPLSEKTVAANVLRWRTGALNIDACRVATDETITATRNIALGSSASGVYGVATVPGVYQQKDGGRWPANIVTDGSPEVVALFPSSISTRGNKGIDTGIQGGNLIRSGDKGERLDAIGGYDDSGSAARFFYSAKASKADRAGSKHPTIKPVSLMRWLCRLVTPPGGVVLDPFAGSGTTGAAAVAEGFAAVLCEREVEYVQDIKRRLERGSMDLPAAVALYEHRQRIAASLQLSVDSLRRCA